MCLNPTLRLRRRRVPSRSHEEQGQRHYSAFTTGGIRRPAVFSPVSKFQASDLLRRVIRARYARAYTESPTMTFVYLAVDEGFVNYAMMPMLIRAATGESTFHPWSVCRSDLLLGDT